MNKTIIGFLIGIPVAVFVAYRVTAYLTAPEPCGDLKTISSFLSDRKEEVVFYGIRSGDSKEIWISSNSRTGSWTRFEIEQPDRICIKELGSGVFAAQHPAQDRSIQLSNFK